ncbi:hypothetical protein [Natronorubrum halophilum]|uniref:hypothetical protein n=1 Tax=Natronorubrum halophilum TaxID=1702106 RepID=UPI001EE79E8D|nr:hypothetical protein [Natronorubrum halophilum]
MSPIDASPGFLVSSLPWWLAAPVIQLVVLVFGMALDETYVNRVTILTGALAVQIHAFVAGDVGMLVGLYGDLGLVIGTYGLYAYVIDGYVGDWFRLLAYFVYSPLSVALVILAAGPTLFGVEPLVVPALVLAGYGNHQFREYLRPDVPYYFGPESRASFEAVVETEATAGTSTETPTANSVESTAASAATRADTESATAAPAEGDTTANDSGEPTANDGGEPTAATGHDAGAASFDDATATDSNSDDGSGFDHPGVEPATAADSSERGILPEFMRRL